MTPASWHRRLLLALALATLLSVIPWPGAPDIPAALADDDGGSGDGGGDDGGGDDGGDDGGNGSDGDGGNGDDDGGSREADDDDHDRALQQRRAGSIAPLQEILAGVKRRHGGTILDARLKSRKGHRWYEIRLLDRHNRLRNVQVPADSAAARRYNFTPGRRYR